MKWIIRTSDRKRFKECRLAWDLGSKIRQDLEPLMVREPLDRGTEIHAGLERWYDPKLWTGTVGAREAMALIAFQNSWKQHRDMYEEAGLLSEEVLNDHLAWKELGQEMIKGYVQWSRERDKYFTPIYTEIEFEVPITVNNYMSLPDQFGIRVDAGQLPALTYQGSPVVYQGRIDLIFQDEDGNYWLVDHKTCGPRAWAEESYEFLIRDEQCKSYAWAIQQQLGIAIRGVIYNELYKGAPAPPKRLERPRKGLSYSTNKSQDTTFDLALETFKANDREALKRGMYDDYLLYLKEGGREFFRRNRVTYTPQMLEILGDQICNEAIDMISNPRIYPNPSKFSCRWCDYKTPCEALLDGQPIDWMKETMYVKRSNALEVKAS